MSWIAENVPWYMINPTVEHPWRDEDLGMSATIRVAVEETEEDARDLLVTHLLEISEYNHVKNAGEQFLFISASDFIHHGGDGVRIHGRYYRVREA